MSILLSLLLLIGGTAADQEVGVATWYDATRNGAWYTQEPRRGAASRNQDIGPVSYYAAVYGWRWADEPYRLRVCRRDQADRCVVVVVVDWCSCSRQRPGRRAIDLSPAAFQRLAPLGRGVIPITVQPWPDREGPRKWVVQRPKTLTSPKIGGMWYK